MRETNEVLIDESRRGAGLPRHQNPLQGTGKEKNRTKTDTGNKKG